MAYSLKQQKKQKEGKIDNLLLIYDSYYNPCEQILVHTQLDKLYVHDTSLT
jgi:hypothetical protein